MSKLRLVLCASVASLGLAWGGLAAADEAPAGAAPAAAAPAAPAATPMAAPAMGATLSANPHPPTFDAGPLGNINVDGVISGMAMFQSPSQPVGFLKDRSAFFDITNAQIIVNKSDGPVQFYFQAGAYSFPTLGVPYGYASNVTPNTFGYLPQGYVKLVPNANFSIQAGALPTLIGAELGWTFQNVNVERGLLWNTEPLVSKGVQVNGTFGPWAMSVAVTDGYYTNAYSNVSGLITYTFNSSNSLTFAAEGNAGKTRVVGSLANGQVYNLIYTHTQGPWMIQPYFQFQTTPDNATVGSVHGQIWAGAILAKYSFNSDWSLAGRFEYESESGAADLLGFGPGSSAYSVTLTPTYQHGVFFARPEFSYVGLSHYAKGFSGFGANADKSSEYRLLLETGFLF
ncbi:MAG: porin [Caulobacteraceae bacterium]|nr:porin [Caulobacteraceae bacterium]